MNKRWWITILVIIGVLIIIGILYEKGLLDFEWQGLTMFFAALAGPYMFVKNWLTRNKKVEEIKAKHLKLREKEKIHRNKTDVEIYQKEHKIDELQNEIKRAEKKIKKLEKEKHEINDGVKDMTLKEMQDEAINNFGS